MARFQNYLFLLVMMLYTRSTDACMSIYERKPFADIEINFATFKLYNKNFPLGKDVSENNPISLQLISPDKPLKFVIHGWKSSGENEWVLKLVTALINYDGSNVISVDWDKVSSTINYPYIVSRDLKEVGREIFFLIRKLMEKNISAEKIYLIGHSLGAHVAGYAGEHVARLGRMIGRITGLDPALPFFKGVPRNESLDRSDALFVDIIHTSHLIGKLEPMGHIDFYPDAKTKIQPGCERKIMGLNVFCDHSRAYELLIDSLDRSNKCQMVGFQCSRYMPSIINDSSLSCPGCLDNKTKCAFLGPRAIENPVRGEKSIALYVAANSESPFCLFGYHLKLGQASPDIAKKRVKGELSTGVIYDDGDGLGKSTFQPLTHTFDYEKNNANIVYGGKQYLGKIKYLLLKWNSAEDDIYIANVTIHLMGDEINPPFIGYPSKGEVRILANTEVIYEEI